MRTPETARVAKGRPIGKVPSLTAQIHGLIHDYPEGIGIIKELAQNADDADARLLRVVIDGRCHRGDGLPSPKMAALQGPALLFYNNKTFSKEDFERIQEIYTSGKVRAADKTGQFGKGFNTVYNITDWPSFVTGERVAFFDPHCSVLPEATPSSPGEEWSLAECWDLHPNVVEPFCAAGLQRGQSRFDGTIFRLPLRTPEAARASEICRKPFGEENLRGLVDEFVRCRESLLLFLWNLEELYLFEVGDSGEERELLSVRTLNVEEVRASRQKLLGFRRGDTLEVARALTGRAPEIISYHHRFCSRWAGQEPDQPVTERCEWRVVHCLTLDPAGELLQCVEQMLELEKKAVPLAGAAAQISRKGPKQGTAEAAGGNICCSLPLPIQTDLPVHLNGFFDLDSTRHALTADNLTGNHKVRVTWNQLLVEHVLAPAYAHLILSLAGDLGANHPLKYYKLWPAGQSVFPKPLDALSNEVYQHLAQLKVIRAHGPERWTTAAKVTPLPADWKELSEPLIAEGLALPDPPLPPVVFTAFQKAGVTWNEITPTAIRTRLLHPLPAGGVAVAQAPRPSLRRREWLESLLRFCLSDQHPTLAGLPLALGADGRLRSFGTGNLIYAAGPEERALFNQRPAWFLDRKLAARCGLDHHKVPTGLTWMTAAEVIRRLSDLFPDDHDLRLQTDGAAGGAPTAKRLIAVYRYLLAAIRAKQAIPHQELCKAAIVPDHSGKLHVPGNKATPLLAELRGAADLSLSLAAFGVPLVATNPRELHELIGMFSAEYRSGSVWHLTGPDLVDLLETRNTDKFPDYLPQVYHPLLDFLARAEWRSDDVSYGEEQKEALRQLPIFPTQAGELVSIGDKVFLPGNFTPPDCPLDVHLLLAGPGDTWAPLLQFLGVEKLTRPRFLLEFLLPGYPQLDELQKRTALQWLRDEWGYMVAEAEKEGDLNELCERLREAPLIRHDGGGFVPAVDTHDPESSLIRDVFGSEATFPNYQYYSQAWADWLTFFRKIGMSPMPLAQQLLNHIDRIRDKIDSQGLTSESMTKLRNVFDHVVSHWAELREQDVEDIVRKPFCEALKKREWLPAERDPQRLKCWPGATNPAPRLFKGEELYDPVAAPLVASQEPILAFGKVPDTCRADLGIQADPPLDVVLAHFDTLLALWESPTRPQLLLADYTAALEAVYEYLSRFSNKPEEARIRSRYADKACLWHNRRFWKAEHAFRSKVPYFGTRRAMIAAVGKVGVGHQVLGIRVTPSLDDHVTYLRDLAREIGTNAIPEEDVRNLLRVYHLLGKQLGDAAPAAIDFPLLTTERLLVPPGSAFHGDAFWFRDRITSPRVHLLHPDLPDKVTRLDWVRSLARDVEELPTGEWVRSDVLEVDGKARELQSNLRSPEFGRGLARLVWHEHHTLTPGQFGWLAQVEVIALRELTTRLLLELDGESCEVGSGAAPFYLDREAGQIYIDGGSQDLLRHNVVESLNSSLGERRLQNSSKLTEILDCSPAGIEAMLDKMRVRRLEIPAELADSEEEAAGSASSLEEVREGSVLGGAGQSTEEASRPSDGQPSGREGGDAVQEPSMAGPPQPGTAPQPASGPRAGTSTRPPVTPPTTARAPVRPSDPASPHDRENLPDGGRPRMGPSRPGERSGGSASPPKDRQPTPPRPTAGGASGTGTPGPAEPPNREGARHSTTDGRDTQRQGGRARGRSRRPRQNRDRIVTYLSGALPADGTLPAEELTEEERRERIDLGNAGVDRVCEFERRHGRSPTPLPHNHPGWDVDSLDAQVESRSDPGAPIRLIEVKAIRGAWGSEGVALSHTQFIAARDHGDRYWLYVVEFADDPDRAVVHPIHDPFSKIREFRFDRGWRQLADAAEAPSAACTLTVGQWVSAGERGAGQVERIVSRGSLRVIRIRLEAEGRLVNIAFDPAAIRPLP